MGTLEGKAALVTGAGRGIGAALAKKLAAEGARVVGTDLDPEPLDRVVSEIAKAGGTALALAGDVTAADFAAKAIERVVGSYGGMDILVNNAGYVWNSRIASHTDEQWYAMIDVHATGPFRLLRAAGRWFGRMAKEGRSGHTRKVVNVSSISGLFGEPTQVSYSAAKSALVGLTRSLAKDWGRYNVTVNCVAFGFIETRLTQAFEGQVPEIQVGDRLHKVGIDAGQLAVLVQAMIPLGRAGTPADAAGAVYLLCIPESDYVSAQMLIRGGGFFG